MTPEEAEEIIRKGTGEIPPAKGRPSPSTKQIADAVEVLGQTTLHGSEQTKEDRDAVQEKLGGGGGKMDQNDIGKLNRIAGASRAQRNASETASSERADLEGPTGPGNPNATNKGRGGGHL